MATKWKGRLAWVNRPTGDGRRFKTGGVSSRNLPQPINWQRQSSEGHSTSVTVGSIEELNIGETEVWGSGVMFDDTDSESLRADVLHVMELIRQGVVGPSVDPGAVQAVEVLAGSDEPLTWEMFEAAMAEVEEGGEFPPIELLFTHYEIAGATLVSTPAFSDVTFCLEEDPAEGLVDNVLAAITGSTDMPVADRNRSWDGDAARQRIFELFTGDDGEVDTSGVARAFLWHDPDSDDSQSQEGWKLPYADVLNGHLEIVPAGVLALAGGRGVGSADVPEEILGRLQARVCQLYDRVRRELADWPTCPFDEDDVNASAEAARKSVVAADRIRAALPPVELFMDPKLDQLPALVREVQPDGTVRVFGHLSDPNSCHRGFRDQCMTPPESMTDYSLFHRYPFETSEGLISVGRITSGLGQVGNSCSHLGCKGLDDHACVNFEFLEAVKHHDGLKTLAWVQVGIDQDRIPGAVWFSGVEVPSLGEAERAVLARRRVSGDWRDLGATRELCEILALAREEPGFEVPRVAVGFRDGRQVSLVAAAQVRPRAEAAPDPAPVVTPGAERPVEINAGTMVAGAADLPNAEELAATAERVRKAKIVRARLATARLRLNKFK
jgi:hypothetical protein